VLKIRHYAKPQTVIIKTNKPEKYISFARNKIHKNSLKSNNLTLGTPIVINPKALKIKEVELEKLFSA
jgi:hypothetical protein